jgi:hypothetical protein
MAKKGRNKPRGVMVTERTVQEIRSPEEEKAMKERIMEALGEAMEMGEMEEFPEDYMPRGKKTYKEDADDIKGSLREQKYMGGMSGSGKKGKTAARNAATLDATSNRATNSRISRGGGAALRGLKFVGVR